jgi:hypothetical protein
MLLGRVEGSNYSELIGVSGDALLSITISPRLPLYSFILSLSCAVISSWLNAGPD